MYSPPPPAAAPLRHPDDAASNVSGASEVPASMIAANPWLTPVRTSPLQPASSSTRPLAAAAAASSDVSRSSALAEPPTEQSRVRALQQVVPPQDDLRFGGGFGNAFGDMQETTLQMPKLAMSSNVRNDWRNRNAAGVPRWNDSEFDRLIRKKLEGPHSARTQFKRTVTERAQGHLSWQWQTLDAVIDGTLAMWEGVQSTGGRLLGMVPDLPDATTCRRMNKAKPMVIDPREDELPQVDPGDDFRDLIAAPASTRELREPIPARIPCAEIPPTPAGSEGLTIMEGSESEPPQAKKAKPREAEASALSVQASSKMTSKTAAALLGGLTKTHPTPPVEEFSLAEEKVIRPKNSKSLTATMNSSKQELRHEDGGMGTVEDEEPLAPSAAGNAGEIEAQPKVAPKVAAKTSPSGKDKSVVVGSTTLSSSAGALGDLAKSRPESPAEERQDTAPSPSREAAVPKKSAAKSVLNQSAVMTSSAAATLGALGALAEAATAPGAPGPAGQV